MSPQLSPIRPIRLEDVGETDSLIFGEASRLQLGIPKALIAKIWEQVEDGVRILPRGGAEVGGLLVGPKSPQSTVHVDEIIPLSIEYKHGPSFHMSASDLAKIAVHVESVQVDPSKAVVGFYRSQRRGNETFRDSDREIFDAIEAAHASFAANFRCYFVLAPVSKSETLVCISMRNGEDWDGTQFTLRSNPFSIGPPPSSAVPQVGSPAQMQVGHPVEGSLAPAVPRTSVVAEQGPARTEPKPKTLELPSRLLYAAVCLLILVGAAIGYPWIVKSRTEPTSTIRVQTSVPPLRMGFSANREGPVWKLSWDRGAMDAIKPSGAVLIIKDGNNEQQLTLAPADLSNGTIFYTPQSGDLVFSLQLQNGGATPLEEHIRVLEGPQNVPKLAERNPQSLTNNTAVQAKASSRGSSLPAEPPRTISSDTGRNASVSRILSPVQPTPAPTETGASPTIIREAPPSPVEISPPPAVAFAVPVAPRFEPPVNIAPPPTAIPQPPQNPGVSAPQKIAPASESAVRNPPSGTGSTSSIVAAAATSTSAAVPTPVQSSYIGPVPVQQVRPQAGATTISSGVQIQVHVAIDTRGNVTKATPIGGTVANFSLTTLTVRAARSWHFEPAKMEGRPVPSEMDLIFKF